MEKFVLNFFCLYICLVSFLPSCQRFGFVFIFYLTWNCRNSILQKVWLALIKYVDEGFLFHSHWYIFIKTILIACGRASMSWLCRFNILWNLWMLVTFFFLNDIFYLIREKKRKPSRRCCTIHWIIAGVVIGQFIVFEEIGS